MHMTKQRFERYYKCTLNYHLIPFLLTAPVLRSALRYAVELFILKVA